MDPELNHDLHTAGHLLELGAVTYAIGKMASGQTTGEDRIIPQPVMDGGIVDKAATTGGMCLIYGFIGAHIVAPLVLALWAATLFVCLLPELLTVHTVSHKTHSLLLVAGVAVWLYLVVWKSTKWVVNFFLNKL